MLKKVKVQKSAGSGIVEYRYYEVIDGIMHKISNMEYIEKSVLEGNIEKKDTDFNGANSTVGLFFQPKKSSKTIQAEKKLKSIEKKIIKKPNRIQKLIKKITENCQSIKKIEDILLSSYDSSVIQLQIDLEESKRTKDKLVKKLSKLLYGKTAKLIDEMKSEHQYDTIQRKKIKFENSFDKEEKKNPFYPFNTSLSIECKRELLFDELGIII